MGFPQLVGPSETGHIADLFLSTLYVEVPERPGPPASAASGFSNPRRRPHRPRPPPSCRAQRFKPHLVMG